MQTQATQAPTQHVFASANTLELSLIEARARMNDELQQALYAALDSGAKERDAKLPEQWDASYTLTPALGTWEDGAEPSQHLAWVHPREYDALEVAEQVARQFNQKAVLVFSERAKGSDKLWQIDAPNLLRDELNDALASVGFRTVEEAHNTYGAKGWTGSRAWIVNPDANAITQLARMSDGWNITVHPGESIMVRNPMLESEQAA